LTTPLIDWVDAAKVAAAYLLTVPIGLNREREEQHAGVRTFPIVSMASCGYMLIVNSLGDASGSSRVLQGLVAGIGFVGGGAIVKDGPSVRGTATAASIWTAGAIGAACALAHYEIAVLLAVINLFTLWALAPLKKKLDKGPL
jgi:putative Mg2+ transporter-C (MgtC) family protein